MAAGRFADFGNYLMQSNMLFHDDKIADFGGNDGTASNAFYLATGIRPTVVDCEPDRIAFARQKYGLRTVLAFVEDLSQIPTKSINYGFCSHTLEHTREPEKALREIARVITNMVQFVVPLESHKHGDDNHAHSIVCRRPSQWREMFKSNGWRVTADMVTKSSPVIGGATKAVEYICLAEPA